MIKVRCIVFLLTLFLLISIIVSAKIDTDKKNNKSLLLNKISYDEFYFVHITDTHVIHEIFDRPGNTKMRLKNVLENIRNFDNKPAFIVITGDLVEWGGSGYLGALNYQAFIDCFYENNGQFYADSDLNIPIYMTPGNHDYLWEDKLTNYNKYINNENKYVITYENTSLFFMDSGSIYLDKPLNWFLILGNGLYDHDIAWLEEKLSNCQSIYKIVLMHHPAVNDRTDFGRMIDVIARNRLNFIQLCEEYNVELVLTGHTHHSRVYDSDENFITDLPLNCNDYPTLFVQTDDCKQGIHYRNISITNNGIILEDTQELEYNPNIKSRFPTKSIINMILDILIKI